MAASQTGYTLAEVGTVTTGEVSVGNFRVVIFDVTPTASSYFTTGYLITAANLGLRALYGGVVLGINPAAALTTTYVPIWDQAHTALQYWGATASSGLTE